MLAVINDIKREYENFHQEGYLMIHRAMVKDINDMVAAADRFSALGREDSTKLYKWFQFYWEMLEVHHVEEDTHFFPEVLERVPSVGATLEVLSQDHQELHGLVDAVGNTLLRLQTLEQGQERTALTQDLTQHLKRFRDMLTDHLEREEAAIVPAISNNFTAQEQEASGNKTMKRMPMKHMANLVPWIASTLTPEEEKEAFKTLPLPVKIMYVLSWKKKYAKFSSVIHV